MFSSESTAERSTGKGGTSLVEERKKMELIPHVARGTGKANCCCGGRRRHEIIRCAPHTHPASVRPPSSSTERSSPHSPQPTATQRASYRARGSALASE